MIDWITAHVPIRSSAALRTGEVTSSDEDGLVKWVVHKRKSVQGSYSGTVTARQVGSGVVEVAGSPAKFLQGHNIFGSDDLRGIGAEMIERVCESLDLELQDHELCAIRAGRYELKRVDINYSFATGSRGDAIAWIDTAVAVGNLRQRGRGKLYKSGSAVWGESSRYWKIKAYSKGAEIEAPKHQLPKDLPERAQLAEWSNDKLRVEVELHARQLQKLGLKRVSSWLADTPSKLFQEYVAKLQLGGQLKLSDDALASLPYRLRETYTNWKRGEDMKLLMSRSTYHRRRKELFEYGFNIAAPPSGRAATTVSLSQCMATPCVEVPSWAQRTELYYEPAYDDAGVMGGKGSVTVRRKSGVTRTASGAARTPEHRVFQ